MTMMHPYRVYDVFTKLPFGGNQLAVFPDAEALPQDRLQAVAAEFNFSEVTFVYPPNDPNCAAKVRIFTPTMEIDFAGHPTIGTAVCLHDLGFPAELVLELGVGPIPCLVDGASSQFTTTAPLEILGQPDVDLVAACLGISSRAIRTDTHAPVQASIGLPFVIVELTSREQLASCQPDLASLRQAVKHHPVGHDFSMFVYVREGGEEVDARMFAPLDNIGEDPATGSASATLAALLVQLTGKDVALSIRQGEDMGRPSHITARADQQGVTISGDAVLVMEGNLTL